MRRHAVAVLALVGLAGPALAQALPPRLERKPSGLNRIGFPDAMAM